MENGNRLKTETSPYLLQHAHNPVNWHPWDEEALSLARTQDKPILLSIGYSACHWCHVMAHESFEDSDTAQLMNEYFVNIKVDREERPDLDKVYQLAHQLLRQAPGGWPLTMFLEPQELHPFFGGTYFPPEPRHGLPGFPDLLRQVHAAWRTQRDAIRRQGANMDQVLEQITRVSSHAGDLEERPLARAREQLRTAFDPRFGGFSGAPKFPHAEQLAFLLDWSRLRDDPQALHMAVFTLECMARGGIFDQLGGGFCRYSVDERWMVPHFEKMLYDNGPLLALYATAAQEQSHPLFAATARATADWVLEDMRAPEGAFYASLDADSEGGEGTYYLWDRDVTARLLEPEEFRVAEAAWGLDQPQNFEGRYWHLYRRRDDGEIAAVLQLDPAKVDEMLAAARRRLLAERHKRERPGLDDKVLTAWNALMIRGLAVAGRSLVEPRYVDAAATALAFVRQSLWRDGVLLAAWKAGAARFGAYLDDYAFTLDAVLELLQCRWNDADLQFARLLADQILERFEDSEAGGFFFTPHDHDIPMGRLRPFADEATPSGNGIATLTLQRLAYLTGESRYAQAATRCLRAAWGDIERVPAAHTSLLRALSEHLAPPAVVVVRAHDDEGDAWSRALQALPPNVARFLIPDSAGALPGVLGACRWQAGGVAYVCRGTRCSAPVTEPDRLAAALDFT